MDVAYGLSATFLFDMAMIVVFPLLGRALGLSDAAFGLWAGTAVNDTSSVVATGYAFSEAARRFRHHGQAHPHAVHHSGGAGVLGDQSAY